jgi:hypothetical protein
MKNWTVSKREKKVFIGHLKTDMLFCPVSNSK